MRTFYFLIFSIAVLLMDDIPPAEAQKANYDESKIPSYTLPEILKLEDGTAVTSTQQWNEKRRPEIVQLFAEHVYGKSPTEYSTKFKVLESANNALSGKANRKQVLITVEIGGQSHSFEMLIYSPAATQGPVPVMLGLNFRGNHTTQADPAIRITESWVPNEKSLGAENNRAGEKGRGAKSSRWPVSEIVARGFAVATIYCGDIDPDFHDEFKNGLHQITAQTARKADSWGTISAWSFGLSRALDYLESDDAFDAKKVSVLGHSRLGKTSLWAGAQDPRFAIIISNNSGCGGAALSRRKIGETVARINRVFPHWFCENYKKYNDNEDSCPVDQHQLIAASAPRPVYVTSASQDRWADPRGELISTFCASRVYKELFQLKGLPVAKDQLDEQGMPKLPETNSPIMGELGYHIRKGKHDITSYDWQRFMDFAEKHFQ